MVNGTEFIKSFKFLIQLIGTYYEQDDYYVCIINTELFTTNHITITQIWV